VVFWRRGEGGGAGSELRPLRFLTFFFLFFDGLIPSHTSARYYPHTSNTTQHKYTPTTTPAQSTHCNTRTHETAISDMCLYIVSISSSLFLSYMNDLSSLILLLGVSFLSINPSRFIIPLYLSRCRICNLISLPYIFPFSLSITTRIIVLSLYRSRPRFVTYKGFSVGSHLPTSTPICM